MPSCPEENLCQGSLSGPTYKRSQVIHECRCLGSHCSTHAEDNGVIDKVPQEEAGGAADAKPTANLPARAKSSMQQEANGPSNNEGHEGGHRPPGEVPPCKNSTEPWKTHPLERLGLVRQDDGRALVERMVAELLRLQAVGNGLLSADTGRTSEEITRDFSRDKFMTPTEAKEYGFIDHILDVPARG